MPNVDTAGLPVQPSSKPWWMPDRKVYSGGITFVLAWALLAAAAHFGYPLQAWADTILGAGALNLQMSLSGALAFGVMYIMPASEHDIYTKLNNRIIALGLIDPNVPITKASVTQTALQSDFPAPAPTNKPPGG